MKNSKHLFLTSLLAVATASVFAQSEDVPTAYGWLDSDTWAAQNGETSRRGLASFALSDPTNITVSRELTYNNSLGSAVFHDGLWYYMDYYQTDYGYDSGTFNSLDPETGDVTLIADYGRARSGPMFACMTWSYADQKMYALNGLNGGDGLVSVDLETGDVKNECLFVFDVPDTDQMSSFNNTLKSLAITYDGDIYGVSYWGKVYKVNPNTGVCNFVSKLSYIGEVTSYSGTALQYPHNNFFYDEDRGQWYLYMYTYPYPSAGYTMLLKVDITTGTTELVESNKLAAQFEGLYIPFQVAEASAPSKVTDLTVTPGENGALQATIEWNNPTTTFGRGGTLISIESVVVYRDGEVIKTFTGVAPGEHLSMVDEVPESRFYSYRVQCFNEAGPGDRKAVSAFIGHDTPMAVTELTATADDSADHKITVSWTAPTTGIYGGWIDVENLCYRVVRSDGETLYNDFKETSFTDAPASLANYSYTITAVTPDGESAPATSNPVVGGPAVLLPHTFTFSEEEFPLWTVYDNNGDEIAWRPTGQYTYNALYPGAYVGYSYYYGVAGADWLISPAIKFEANKHYKLSFDARSYGSSPECLAISMGKSNDWMDQDSIDQFDFASTTPIKLRTNLPILSEEGEYHIGFFARSFYQNWQLSIANATIEEDHDGSLTGTVTDATTGAIIPLALVTLTASDGTEQQINTNPETGVYTFRYVPSGTVSVKVERLGYENAQGEATITEFEQTTLDIVMTALPTYTLSGTVVDKVGDPVSGAQITLEGYNEYAGSTDAEGKFSIAGIMASENYNLSITSNRLQPYQAVQPMVADTDLGTITLDDKILAPAQITAQLNEAGVPEITWSNPVNDDVTLRYDANLLYTSFGTSQSSSYAVFGNIFRTPGLYRGAQFYLSETGQTVYGVTVYAFDLDENGQPTQNVLASKYVSVIQGAWNNMTFDQPVEAPRGAYICVAYYGFVGLGASEPNDSYPFVEGVSCYTGDYTSGQFFYIESAGYRYNFMFRATVAPYDTEEKAAEAKFRRTEQDEQMSINNEQLTINNELGQIECHKLIKVISPAEPSIRRNAIGDRTWFDLYRLTPTTAAQPETWTQLLDSVKARTYTDEGIAELPMGTYEYAVRCHYTDGLTSTFVFSDSIGWKMHTKVTVKLTTNTPTNEAEGAWVQIVNGGGVHAYGDYADANGEVTFENVWKANYDLYVNLKGFGQIFETVKLDIEDSYTIERQLTETQVTPFGLKVINDDETDLGNRLFIWNFADQLYDGFEEHEAFAINSPGELGWQYLDFDNPDEGTGYLNDLDYPNRGGSFAYLVFNLSKANGNQNSYSYYFSANSGQQMLTSWANSTDQNWLVSPRLFFDEDFKFGFYAKGYGYQTETFMVGYTTSTDYTDTASYQWLEYVPVYSWEIASEEFKVNSYWTRYVFDIPADAQYVTIRQIDGNYIFMIDDVAIGLPEGFPAAAPQRKAQGRRQAPSLDGAYKVYLDGELVDQTDDKQYYFEGLTSGEHTAGVIASYTSGDTEMSTITFSVEGPDNIETIRTESVEAPAYDIYGRRVDANNAHGVFIQKGEKMIK